jgi:hypothetical protein
MCAPLARCAVRREHVFVTRSGEAARALPHGSRAYTVNAVLWDSHHLRSASRWGVLLAAAALLAATLASEAAAAPTIRFKGNGLDRFKFHGRVKLDPPFLGGRVDPLTSGFSFELLNANGLVYGAALLPGDMEALRNLYYRFRDPDARTGEGSRGGIFQILTRFREYSDGWYYTVRIVAFSDLSSATEPRMTVLFYEVDGNAGITADWVPTNFGWRLPLNRFGP